MRGLYSFAAVLAALASLAPRYGFSEQPQGMTVAATETPSTVAWTSRAPDFPRMSETPPGAVPTIGGPGERLGSSETKDVGDVEIQPVVNEGSFLLPTWDRGFWLMPPGGLQPGS